jgi:Flp pilus assembly pilin Flp
MTTLRRKEGAMDLFTYVRAWLAERLVRAERGQGSIEYVLLILGCVLFLIAAAILLKGMLAGAVTAISSWANTVGPP